MTKKFIKVLVAVGASVALLGPPPCQSGSLANTGGAATGSAGAKVTIKFLNTNDKTQIAVSEAMAKAFNAAQDKYFVQTDNSRPGGGDGDNIIKTRLATGEMADVFVYNSGSLMQAIKPEQNLQPVDDQPWLKDARDDFKKATVANSKQYGAPWGSGSGGGCQTTPRIKGNIVIVYYKCNAVT